MLRQIVLLILIMAGFIFPLGFIKAGDLPLSPDVFVSSDNLFQGDTLLVVVKNETKEITGSLGSIRLRFFRNKDNQDWVALTGAMLNKQPGNYSLVINVPGKPVFEKNIMVLKKEFITTPLVVTQTLSRKGYTLKKIVSNATNKDNKILAGIFGKITPESYINQPFIFPLSEVNDVGAFGNIRQAQGYQMQHLGTDLKASINTPIYAVNSGKVVFAGTLYNCGKTIVIDHGLGVYSLYAHLGYIDVQKGQSLKQGEIIGLSGNTGYSVAPHLHFSIKVRNVSLDPLKFIQATQSQW